MPFRFKQTKTVQTIAQLLLHADGSDDYLRIVKLLYIASRRCIKEAAYPIVGGPVVAMKHGPVSIDLTTLRMNSNLERQGHKIYLIADPGVGELSPFIIGILKDTWSEYKDKGCWHVTEETRGFDEWKRHWAGEAAGSVVIPYKDIFEAVGCKNYEQAESDEQGYNAVDDLLSRTRG